jgi:sugar/nucleoside kinase (ribokinase family)
MNRLLVIGGASIDVLHLDDQSVETAGGAGMYTAMAAKRCGAHIVLFGPCPDPCPEQLKPVVEHLAEWIGPVIMPAQVLQFEISYRGRRTEYLKAEADAERALSPTTLPADLSGYDLVHVTPLGDPSHQLSFVQACRERGAILISAGTWPGDAIERPDAVRAVMEESDFFFMNNREAEALFGSLEAARTEPGRVLFITLGEQGACIIQGDTATCIPAISTNVLDPTGAGDTFCGATLAYLLHNQHPIMAARGAVALAAEMIGQVGPTALLSEEPPPEAPLDSRVRVNDGQVRRIAERLSTFPEASPYPTVGPTLPPVGHPKAVDYFFAATLQQFSFWSVRNNHYDLPLIAEIGGVKRKGSDYLWYAITRQLLQDPEFCIPERQANLSREELLAVFRADDGQDPMPALDLHLEQAREYGQDMLALQLTPQVVLDKALVSPQPLQTFLEILDQVSGYKEDPIRKKSLLLAMLLHNRPEAFLPLRDDEQIAPIVDYHFMRLFLRLGLIDVLDGELETKLTNQQIVSPGEEWAVRYPTYLANEGLLTLSGVDLSRVNGFLFSTARERCLEMTEPECSSCKLDPVCAHRKGFFQPVIRTSFY